MKAEDKMRVSSEGSTQAGSGMIRFYSKDDDSVIGDLDYEDYNIEVIEMALDSKNKTEFVKKYTSWIKGQLGI